MNKSNGWRGDVRSGLALLASYALAAGLTYGLLAAGFRSEGVSAGRVTSIVAVAAAGPLFPVTVIATGAVPSHPEAVGPAIGLSCVAAWCVVIACSERVRVVSPLFHFLGAVLWLFCGVMIMLAFSGK